MLRNVSEKTVSYVMTNTFLRAAALKWNDECCHEVRALSLKEYYKISKQILQLRVKRTLV
jgi:hypothetical protein